MGDEYHIRDFVLRIIAGEKMENPEDLQFYLNWRTTIEEYLLLYHEGNSPFSEDYGDED